MSACAGSGQATYGGPSPRRAETVVTKAAASRNNSFMAPVGCAAGTNKRCKRRVMPLDNRGGHVAPLAGLV